MSTMTTHKWQLAVPQFHSSVYKQAVTVTISIKS